MAREIDEQKLRSLLRESLEATHTPEEIQQMREPIPDLSEVEIDPHFATRRSRQRVMNMVNQLIKRGKGNQ